MLYVGIDWAYRRAAWCAKNANGEIHSEGVVPADEDGLAKLVLTLGTDVTACVEMMSGAVWVRDRLRAAGWHVGDCRRSQGQGGRAVGMQDRQGRRAGAGRVVPAGSGAGRVGAVADPIASCGSG